MVDSLPGKTRHERIKYSNYTSLKNRQNPSPASALVQQHFPEKQENQPFSTSCSVCGKTPLWYHRIPAKVEGIQSTYTCLHVLRVLKGRWISLPLAGTPQTEDLHGKTECHFARNAHESVKTNKQKNRTIIITYSTLEVKYLLRVRAIKNLTGYHWKWQISILRSNILRHP